MKKICLFLLSALVCTCFSCRKYPEMTLEEIESARAAGANHLIEKTVSKPNKSNSYVAGRVGGSWNTAIMGDPKSFNLLIAEKDASTVGILAPLTDSLVDYDVVKKEWIPRLCSFKIITDEKNNKMDLVYTLRDDIYWSFYQNSKARVKVTSDDVIFWYDEIYGDPECASSGYSGQFMIMDDGSSQRITIEKINDLTFVFHFPKIIAEPLLTTNMNFGPAFIYKEAKDRGGVKALKELFTVASDPKTIPSCGSYFLTEYTPSQRLVYKRNPDYWEKDARGENTCYPQERICQIIGDLNTAYLLFKEGKMESYSPTPEQLEEVVSHASNALAAGGEKVSDTDSKKSGYTVFNAEGNMDASFWSFNQNPQNQKEKYYSWFVKKEFRQAMSCLLNRERIIQQTYRGLGEPKYSFFPEANKYYDSSIILQYRYSHSYAQKLLQSSGFSKKEDGSLYDENGNKVEFDLSYPASSGATLSDVVQIIVDECKKEGITVTPRPTDFQKLVDQLFSSYDWQTVIIGFSGSSIFPSQGNNVWPSNGNLHLWYPLQKSPATDWEARVDYLYNKAQCIIDYEKAKPLWDEYQQIILEQCPVIYLVRARSFFALQNRWDMSNFYYDNLNGSDTRYLFLKE